MNFSSGKIGQIKGKGTNIKTPCITTDTRRLDYFRKIYFVKWISVEYSQVTPESTSFSLVTRTNFLPLNLTV